MLQSPFQWWARQSRAEKSLSLVALAIGLVLIGSLSWQFRRGVGLADEALYLSLFHRFFLGDKPFVDEVSVPQTATLVSYPLFRVFVFLKGGNDGIFLFSRHLYLAMCLAASCLVYVFARRHLSSPLALLLALIPLGDIPVGVPALSYNTIGFFGWLGAVLLAADRELSPRRMAAISLFHGIAVLAYPPLLLACVVHDLILFFGISSRRGRAALCLVTPAVLFGLTVMIAFGITPADILSGRRASMAMLGSQGYTLGFEKVLSLFRQLFPPYWPFLVFLVLLAVFACRRSRSAFAVFSLLLIPVLYFVFRARNGGAGFAMIPLYLGLACPAFWFFDKDDDKKRLIRLVWIPSVAAGMIFAWASLNGLSQGSLGLAPASYLSLVFLLSALNVRFPARAGILAAVSLAAFYLLPPYFLRNGFPTPDLPGPFSRKAESGPYSGMWMPERMADVLSILSRELPVYEKPDGRIIFYPLFPPGYLLSKLRPAAEMVWAIHVDLPHAANIKYLRGLNENSVAVRVNLSVEEVARPSGESYLAVRLRELQNEQEVGPITIHYGLRPGSTRTPESPYSASSGAVPGK